MQLRDDVNTETALNATFAALADPTRRAMLERLAQGPASINTLAAPFALSLPTVSRHLKVLEAAGLVAKARAAQFRLCRLEVAPLQSAGDWIGQYRDFFSDRFDRLEAQLKQTLQTAPDNPVPVAQGGPKDDNTL